jgi:lysophospholipase L1-like esterase
LKRFGRTLACLLGAALSLACESGTRRERPASSAAAPPPTAITEPAPSQTAPPELLHLPPESQAAPAQSAPASAAPPPAESPLGPCRVALIGDSLTDFRNAGGGRFVRYLEQRSPKTVFANFAKGGAMVNQMRRHFEASVLAEPPGSFTHLLLFGGVNDLYSDETAGRTPAKIEADLTFMYDAAKQRGLRVVALTVAPWGGFKRYDNPRRRAATLELNDWIREQAKLGKVDVVVDAYSRLSCGDPALLCPRYEAPHADGLHFGKAGHEVLGQALYEAEFRRCS